MKTTYLSGTEPGVKELGQAVGYTGRKYAFKAVEEVQVKSTYWDGGSRSTWTAVKLSTRQVVPLPKFDPPQFGGPQSIPPIPLEQDMAIIEHSIFCGKDMGLTIYIHPSDSPQMITETDSATDDEKIVLEFTAALKNTYGGRTNIRLGEARRQYGITLERWEAAQGTLKERKLLTKVGSITPSGRNIDTSPYRS
jgi:hypothetical protein